VRYSLLLRFILWHTNIDWTKYRPATCLPNHCFCEAIGSGFVRQPIDAYSNVFYLIAGVAIFWYLLLTRRVRTKHAAQTELPRDVLFLFGFAAIAVGIGSFLYHAGFTFFGMELDDDAMYLVGSFTLFFGYAHLHPITLKQFLILFFILNLFLEILIFFYPVVRGLMFGVLVLATLLVDRMAIRQGRMKNQSNYLLWGIELFFLAYFFWALDDLRIVCYPTSSFQGHSVWHFLTAIVVFVLFLYMDSEFLELPKGKLKG
jgi:hypothetical protein